MEDLRQLAEEIATAEKNLSGARRVLDADKQKRKGSIIGRIMDFLSETNAEEDARLADESLTGLRGKANSEVGKFVEAEALRYLTQDEVDIEARAEQVARTNIAQEAADIPAGLLRLADKARDAYTTAASSCRSASNMELVDALSKNKGLSVMSTLSTGNAKTAVKAANDAYGEFAEAYKAARDGAGAVEVPDDMTDLVFDMMLPSSFDFLSILNMQNLGSIASKCEEAATGLLSMRASIEADLNAKLGILALERAELFAIDRPYLERASDVVPQALVFALPDYASHTAPVAGSAPRP